MFNGQINLILDRIILFFIGLLVFILPIGHTVAIRHISIWVLFILILSILINKKLYKSDCFNFREVKIIISILCLFTIWLYFVGFFISNETSWSLSNIKTDWLSPLMYFITFFLIGLHSINKDINFQKNVYLLIFLIMFIHILYIDMYSFKYFIEHKAILSRFSGLTDGPDKANYITNIVLVFLVSEIIYRFRTSNKILEINNFVLTILVILTLLSSVFESMRNGSIAIVFLSLTCCFFSLFGNEKYSKKLKILISICLFFVITIPTSYNLSHDKRWDSLIETISIALNTKDNKAWIDRNKYPYPKLSNGQEVSVSNYERIAWAYEGLKLVVDNPLGIGYGKNTFGHAIQEKYNTKNRTLGHSHSGIIDLAIGVGFIGVAVWLVFCLYLMFISYSYFMKTHSFYSLILFFNVSGFFIRFIVDSNMRDHMFQTFMLISGLSFILMIKEQINKVTVNEKN